VVGELVGELAQLDVRDLRTADGGRPVTSSPAA
jgi:hypothetical protein